MAIDTETRRRSVQAYTFGLMRPVPDAAIGAGDRAIATWLYSGLFDGGGEPPVEEVLAARSWSSKRRRLRGLRRRR